MKFGKREKQGSDSREEILTATAPEIKKSKSQGNAPSILKHPHPKILLIDIDVKADDARNDYWKKSRQKATS
jgi:hypothetical protein